MHEENLKEFEKVAECEAWFSTQPKLSESYAGKFLAVVSPGKIIADENIEKLLGRLEKEEIDIGSTFITAIPSKGVASIL